MARPDGGRFAFRTLPAPPHAEAQLAYLETESSEPCRARPVVGRNPYNPDRTAGPYFTAPAVSPPTMYFCRKRNSATTGSADITAPAENALQSA